MIAVLVAANTKMGKKSEIFRHYLQDQIDKEHKQIHITLNKIRCFYCTAEEISKYSHLSLLLKKLLFLQLLLSCLAIEMSHEKTKMASI